jgi:hypothetical protein
VEKIMTSGQQDKHNLDLAKQDLAKWRALLSRHVLRALGQPDAPHRVEVRHLWEEHYRVNVFIESGTASFRVAHSYFLVTDESGAVLASTPAITRQY